MQISYEDTQDGYKETKQSQRDFKVLQETQNNNGMMQNDHEQIQNI